MQRGIKNEEKVLKDMGLEKNNSKFTVKLPGSGETVTVKPDAISDSKIVEVKDRKAVYNTKQIRGEREVAKSQGKEFKLVVGDKTRVSGHIPKEEITRRPDIGPQK